MNKMNIVITGANGFIGKNLRVFLQENGYDTLTCIDRETTSEELYQALKNANFVFHLAGVNRPINRSEYYEGNSELTDSITRILEDTGNKTPLLITSSIQAGLDNDYGKSKAAAESAVKKYAKDTGAKTFIFRLPNVFGKWCKPNYNSVIATFCHNTLNNKDIIINNPDVKLSLVYIDDVCKTFLNCIKGLIVSEESEVKPVYNATVGEVASIIKSFKEKQHTLNINKVGTGLMRALYATYLSYYSTNDFSYSVARHEDPRGTFVEMLKTEESGQFSFFTAHPGITRGGHYHHTKNEKFLVIKGRAKFTFRHIDTNEYYEFFVDAEESKIVETVPGWSHDITNVGNDEMIVMLWANEIFDPLNPDTVNYKIF